MLEETLDPRPRPDSFARTLAARAAERGRQSDADLAHWLRGWNDREGTWANLRNIEHWIERAGA